MFAARMKKGAALRLFFVCLGLLIRQPDNAAGLTADQPPSLLGALLRIDSSCPGSAMQES